LVVSRIAWDRTTKPFLIDHLNKVKATTGLNVEIVVDRSIINYESVMFSFKDTYCGLTYDQCNEQNIALGLQGDIKQKGAALHFDQRYNGQILIWMEFPYVMFLDRPLEIKSEVLPSLSQNKLDEPTVNKFLQDFLREGDYLAPQGIQANAWQWQCFYLINPNYLNNFK